MWLTFTPPTTPGGPDRHRRALGARSDRGGVADPERADGPAPAQEVREDRARDAQTERHEHEGDHRDHVEATQVQEPAQACPDERGAAVRLEFGRL